MADALTPSQMQTYFALTEAVSLLQYAVGRQLQDDAELSYVQFEILATLAAAEDEELAMTELADGVVYSRSGLTHQAGLLEAKGLVTRRPGSDDRRVTVVTITDAGRRRVTDVLPGHVDVVQSLLFDSLSEQEMHTLGNVMTRVRDHMRALPPRSALARRTADTGATRPK